MAASEQEGTGKHPHKSTEEPYPHHQAPSTRGSDPQQPPRGARGSGSTPQRGESEGRGGEEPESENEEEDEGESSGKSESPPERSASSERSQSSEHSESSEASDLKEREYRDEQGNVHHHTRTSQAYQEKNK